LLYGIFGIPHRRWECGDCRCVGDWHHPTLNGHAANEGKWDVCQFPAAAYQPSRVIKLKLRLSLGRNASEK